jgi:hypothetical protein
MHFMEVFKGVWQLVENRCGGTAIHLADIVPLEGVDEAFRHAVRLRAPVCKLFKEKSLVPYVIKTVRNQQIVFAFTTITFAWYFWGTFIWLMQGAKCSSAYKSRQSMSR